MLAPQLHVPRIRVDHATTAVVTQWGEVGGFVLRPGDRLLLGGDRRGLVMLMPRGFGNPMLGRVTARGLVAEPGGVPASHARWSVLGGVQAVERSLERGAGLASGRWAVVVRVVGGPTEVLALGELAGAGRTAAEVDALLRRALVAARRDRVDIHVGLAGDLDTATQLADAAGANQIRIGLSAASGLSCPADAAPAEPAGRVIIGPWAGAAPAHAVARDSRQLALFQGADRSRVPGRRDRQSG
jgi:hypothetical protein